MQNRIYQLITLSFFWGLMICISNPGLASDLGEISDILESRTNSRLSIGLSKDSEIDLPRLIEDIQKNPLSVEDAVRIAWINNKSLQAIYLDLGIAKADVLKAGRLDNPVFEGEVKFPHDSSSEVETEFTLEQNFLDILLRPQRKKLASIDYEKVRYMVGKSILDISTDIKSAYYSLQGEMQVYETQESILVSVKAAMEFAQRQYDAGNITELELANRQAMYHEVQLESMETKKEIIRLRELLSRLMGLSGEMIEWTLFSQLPDLPMLNIPFELVQSNARTQRLDLAIAKQDIESSEQRLKLIRKSPFTKLDLGIKTEHGAEGDNSTGPVFKIDLPIFNKRKGDILRLEYRIQQQKWNLANLENKIDSDMRETYSELSITRDKTEYYRERLIPLRKKILDQTQLHYNAMLTGVYELLLAYQNTIETNKKYIESLRDYWITFTRLEQVTGGWIDVPSSIPRPSNRPVKPETENQNHH